MLDRGVDVVKVKAKLTLEQELRPRVGTEV